MNTYELLVHWEHVRLSQSVTLLPRISRVRTIGWSRRGMSCLVQYIGAKDHVLETWSTKSSNGVRICQVWHTESIQTRDVSPFACPKFGCVLDLRIIPIVQWEITIWMFKVYLFDFIFLWVFSNLWLKFHVFRCRFHYVNFYISNFRSTISRFMASCLHG